MVRLSQYYLHQLAVAPRVSDVPPSLTKGWGTRPSACQGYALLQHNSPLPLRCLIPSPLNCISFASQYPELMVASYNNNEDAPHEPDGVALVWNMKFKKTTPEYVFHCQVRPHEQFVSCETRRGRRRVSSAHHSEEVGVKNRPFWKEYEEARKCF